ncbi:mitochondrial carrier [Basidiobolus meristosporus CBS 931.73]|uniref:Mitochondrial carrier n=1 Tax=Basidiobolus meristosporus CBS 931.73 TaxID=1314790 RepID=A0A1Y1YK56_9FUNG|nr:mitochondrial carrier [Basidiobolus meristosporus CBS 931.73]|eukprot:ORX98223.1 mitochondrial carrier [Basidiobolus meristosporus CBS 931.73]
MVKLEGVKCLAFFKPIFERLEGKVVPKQSSAALAGVCTGLVQAIGLVTPLELLKVRQQTDLSGKYATQFGTIRHIFKEEGILAFYKGLLPTIVRQSWGLAIKFSCYTHIKGLFEDSSDPTQKLSPWKHMASGGLANVIVGILNSPPDVVKTRMQDQSSVYRTSWECSKLMLKQEGISSFFRGAWLRVLRIAPGGAIQFAAYEYLVSLLEG